MRTWKLTGVIATLIITLSFPIYLLRVYYFSNPQTPSSITLENSFTGSSKCADCHRKAYDKWKDSHHDHAMENANKKTVLGDFNNTLYTNNGITSRFYKKGERFFVNTQGEEGKMKEYEITHTFGWYPLQQYLIPFKGGRLQCLPIA
jgi:hypothetical protein